MMMKMKLKLFILFFLASLHVATSAVFGVSPIFGIIRQRLRDLSTRQDELVRERCWKGPETYDTVQKENDGQPKMKMSKRETFWDVWYYQ